MKVLSSADRIFCLAVLLKYREHLKEITSLLPPQRGREIDQALEERAGFSEQQMKDEFHSVATAEYEEAARMATRALGFNIEQAPLLIRNCMLRQTV